MTPKHKCFTGEFYYGEKDNEDKPKIAVALEYTPGEQAPKILATGRGHIAESIIEKPEKQMFLYMKIPSLPVHYQSLK